MSKPDSLLKTPRSWRIGLVAWTVAISVVTLAASVTSAHASQATTFATLGEGAGQVNDAEGVAVDKSNGMVYISDKDNFRIDEFDENGVFVRAFGYGVRTGAKELQTCTVASACQKGFGGYTSEQAGEINPVGVAVDPTTHNVYLSDLYKYRVEEFTSTGDFILMVGDEVDKTTHGDVCTAASHDACGNGVVGTGPAAFSFCGKLGSNTSLPYMPLAGDTSGNIWVGDVNRLEEFSSTGAFLAEVALPGVGQVAGLALDASNDFYIFSAKYSIEQEKAPPGVHKYDSTGQPLNFTSLGANSLSEPGEVDALTYDGAGHLFVGDATGSPPFAGIYRLLEFESNTGAQMESFAAGEVVGGGPGGTGFGPGERGGTIAFGTGGAPRLYAANTSVTQYFEMPPAGPLRRAGSPFAARVGGTTATLKAFLNSEGAETKYRFEYVDQASFETEGGFSSPHTKTTPEAVLPAGFEEPEVTASVTGLAGETTYKLRLVAENANGKGNTEETVTSFTTTAPVLIDAAFATEVAPTSATLNAEINPVGAESSYRFEYLSEAAYQHNLEAGGEPFAGATVTPTPDGPLGSGEVDVAVYQHVRGLVAGTAYRYRVAAHNVGGERFSAVQTIVTQSVSAPSLPDGRAWELVSPAEKHGAPFVGIGDAGIIQAASAGGGIMYLAGVPTEPGSAGYFSEVQVLSERGSGGWSSHDISLPHETPPGVPIGVGQEYRFFSEDLSLAAVQPFGAFVQSLSEEASEQTPYVRTDYLGGNTGDPCTQASGNCFRPLLTGCPAAPAECRPIVEEHADVPAGTVFGVDQSGLPFEQCRTGDCGVQFRGATPDMSHVVLESPAIGLTAIEGDHGGLYEWSGGVLLLVSVLPDEEPAPSVLTVSPTLGYLNEIARNAISTDGSRVVWSYGGHLYERDMNAGVTLQLDKLQGGGGPPGSGPVFQVASSDGRIVYFTDEQRLTAGSGASGGSPDLYECEVVESEGEQSCKLSDLTPGDDVVGAVLGASSDGSYVYFVADGVLAAGASPGTCTHTEQIEPGDVCNLYVHHAGVTEFVAELSSEDMPDWRRELSRMPARVSPDGRWLAFMSLRPLTGYDNHDQRSGKLDEEVFLYHAAGEGSEGKLVCASCDPSGARPVGFEYGGFETLAAGDRVWQRASWLAANVPGWTSYASGRALHQPRYLSDGGRLFFDSRDGLVAQDSNGTQDLYQWEPPGSGDCTTASKAFVASSDGCLALISSGTSPVESAFLDASEDGSDVFFLTASRLAGPDIDNSYDVYDAHVCSASSPCPPPPAAEPAPCNGDACQSQVQAPEDPTPGSLTFSGNGNLLASPGPVVLVKKSVTPTRAQKLAKALRACRRKRDRRKRAVCEAGARKRYGAKGHDKKASVKRRHG